MSKSNKNNILMRIFITFLGIAFIIWGIGSVVLGIVGEKTTAVITEIRREGGERNEIIPGRYTYVVSYTFKLPDGRSIDSFTKRVSDGVYIKNPNTLTSVRYFKQIPFFNTLEENTKADLGKVLLIIIGGLFIFAINGHFKGIF